MLSISLLYVGDFVVLAILCLGIAKLIQLITKTRASDWITLIKFAIPVLMFLMILYAIGWVYIHK